MAELSQGTLVDDPLAPLIAIQKSTEITSELLGESISDRLLFAEVVVGMKDD